MEHQIKFVCSVEASGALQKFCSKKENDLKEHPVYFCSPLAYLREEGLIGGLRYKLEQNIA